MSTPDLHKIHEVHARPVVSELSGEATSKIVELQQTLVTFAATVTKLAATVGAWNSEVGPAVLQTK